jgi:hypothetical protein
LEGLGVLDHLSAGLDHFDVVGWTFVVAQMLYVLLVVFLIVSLVDVGIHGLPSEYGFAQSGGDVEAAAS